MGCGNNFLDDRIAVTRALIIAHEDALLALGQNGGVISYTLDTGQDRQTVTRAEIPAINSTLDSLYNRLAILEARATGNGVTALRPSR